ncbi:MAG: Asp-tRNA(Asn)/Glu-tRNA(Gln) amidotransferase subunit GatC [Nitrospiraceae bacterium]|nr:Asp-tRNA(Asn)/Glu-tRNA(Gln) amidotransferase subunit GatC [Nitrospiraceae bacterium]
MKIDRKEVINIAKLSRLVLSEGEIDLYSEQLSNILGYIGQLNEAGTKDVPPTSHVLDLNNVLREDEVKPSLPPEEALKNAPDPADHFYRVPRIIE